MREFSVPSDVTIAPEENLTDAVFRNAAEAPDKVLFSRKVGGSWEPVTGKDFASEVSGVAAGLIASGVKPGDRVGLMSKTRYEWTLVDYAIWTAGATTVPIYETSSAEQVAWILGDSGAVAVIVETDAHSTIVDEVKGELRDLKHFWTIEDGGIEALTAAGKDVTEGEIEERRRSLTAESLATIIYTSGTTGRPKGCELTHRNFLFDVRSTESGLKYLYTEDSATLLFLPLAHVFARLIEVSSLENRVRVGHTADIKNLLPDLAAFQPTFILSVPRVFEKVYNASKQKAHADGKGKIFDKAEKIAIAYSEALDKGGAGIALKAQHAVFDKLVYTKLRAALGGKVEGAISGGAPLGARLGHFFRGIGVPVYEGYGLTETTAGATMSLPNAMKVGSIGRPIPGTSVRIADDGEILIKGDNVFRGYWHNEKATKEAITSDGWFHSGDIGEIDSDGYIKITGRKKELIVTAGGKNVAPAVLEDRLRAHPLVSQCMVVGDQKPFIACLVTIDAEAFPSWASSNGLSGDVKDNVDNDTLRAEIQKAVDEANKAVSKAEAIKAFTILPDDWTEAGGQMTPSLKMKRNVIAEEFSAEIDKIYAGSKPEK